MAMNPFDHQPEDPAIRNATRDLVEAIRADEWPGNAAAIDFGLDSQRHYEALYYPVRAGEITPRQLDAALGDGEKLTALARAARSNPHPDVVFHTSWDGLLRGREAPAGALSEEEKFRRVLDRLVGGDRPDGRGR
jgi:hypothetical protein